MAYSSRPPHDDLPSEQKEVLKGIAIPSKRTTSSFETTTACGCRCGGCSCPRCFTHGNISFPDSNREAYGGQGTRDESLSNLFATLNASSLEAQEPKSTVAGPPSLELLSKLNDYTPAQLAEARTEQYLGDINQAPWRHFVSERSMTSDATEQSGLFFGPIDIENSLENHPVSRDSRSMLSSYMSVMSIRDDAASAVVSHAGAALAAAPQTANKQHRP